MMLSTAGQGNQVRAGGRADPSGAHPRLNLVDECAQLAARGGWVLPLARLAVAALSEAMKRRSLPGG